MAFRLSQTSHARIQPIERYQEIKLVSNDISFFVTSIKYILKISSFEATVKKQFADWLSRSCWTNEWQRYDWNWKHIRNDLIASKTTLLDLILPTGCNFFEINLSLHLNAMKNTKYEENAANNCFQTLSIMVFSLLLPLRFTNENIVNEEKLIIHMPCNRVFSLYVIYSLVLFTMNTTSMYDRRRRSKKKVFRL